ncbi:hypothetical protein ABN056_08055 [Providencia vermicola]|uniref:hypothetical protein n=1 Tax=Providencia vermicola TaxID=333965 RepID=UPI000D85729D|nr:Uncharacterised protein [Providencia stuartii]
MNWSEILLFFLGDGIALAIFGAIYKHISDKSLDKKIQQGLDNLDLLTESQLTKVLQENIKINDQRKFIRQEMTSNNISHMRQAWINDVRKNAASFVSLTTNIISSSDLYFKLNDSLSKGDFYDKNAIYNKRQMTKDLLIELHSNIRKINELHNYLDLLLPFSDSTLNKSEPEADEIRVILGNIASKTYHVLTNDYNTLSGLMLDLTELQSKLVGELKMLLLKEWRVTKSLNELEDMDKRNDEELIN